MNTYKKGRHWRCVEQYVSNGNRATKGYKSYNSLSKRYGGLRRYIICWILCLLDEYLSIDVCSGNVLTGNISRSNQ